MVHYVKRNLKVIDAREEESHSLPPPPILTNISLLPCTDFSIAIVELPFSHPSKLSLCYPHSHPICPFRTLFVCTHQASQQPLVPMPLLTPEASILETQPNLFSPTKPCMKLRVCRCFISIFPNFKLKTLLLLSSELCNP